MSIRPSFRVMHSYDRYGETVDECVAAYGEYSNAYRHAQQLQSKGYSGVWVQERA